MSLRKCQSQAFRLASVSCRSPCQMPTPEPRERRACATKGVCRGKVVVIASTLTAASRLAWKKTQCPDQN